MARDNNSRSSIEKSQYPFAAAPDIIRSNQKDAYFQGALLEHLLSVLRGVYGARFVHKYATEARTTGDLLYMCFTTLVGNRTLGEEYCDIVQIENDTLKLPSLFRRAGYIVASILVPYALNRWLPSLRLKLRARLEYSLQLSIQDKGSNAPATRIRRYLLHNLPMLTSTAPAYAIGLSIFYFSGAYYHLSKRSFGLRYLFSKRVDPSDQRIGYEVLGVLLVLQMSVQSWLHIQNAYLSETPSVANPGAVSGGTALLPGGVEMGLEPPQADDILLGNTFLHTSKESLEARTFTPVLDHPRYQLSSPDKMAWMEVQQQRKCTLCLEEFKDPSVTTCGHVFCWTCIADWVKEKPECPLCRQTVMAQRILPIRE